MGMIAATIEFGMDQASAQNRYQEIDKEISLYKNKAKWLQTNCRPRLLFANNKSFQSFAENNQLLKSFHCNSMKGCAMLVHAKKVPQKSESIAPTTTE